MCIIHACAELIGIQFIDYVGMQAMESDLQTNLTVKWMFACGGSWAWEAANMVNSLKLLIFQ